jgi:hypothetical protein
MSLVWIRTLSPQLKLHRLGLRVDYHILELVFGIVRDIFIPHYSWDQPLIAYSSGFISLSHVNCTQKYEMHADVCFSYHTLHNLHPSILNQCGCTTGLRLVRPNLLE